MSDQEPFSTASDLWILPPPRLSAWFSVIDWYLNWQMSKGLAYAGLHLPGEIQRLRDLYESELPKTDPDLNAPLLVISHGRVPADKCVVIHGSAKTDAWLKQSQEITLNLGAKKVHVFLPAKIEPPEAVRTWPSKLGDHSISFTADADARGMRGQ